MICNGADWNVAARVKAVAETEAEAKD